MTKSIKKPQPMLLELIKILKNNAKISKLASSDQKIVWSNVGMLSIYFYALKTIPFYPQFFMFKQMELLENLNIIEGKFEIPNDLCTDNKIAIARCLSPDTSRINIPEPDFIVSMDLVCTQTISGFKFISNYKNIPHYNIKIPFIDPKKKSELLYRNTLLKFIKKQFKKMTFDIEKEFDLSFDDNKFKIAAISYLKSIILLEQTINLQSEWPAPIDGHSLQGYIQPYTTDYVQNNYNLLNFYISLYNKTFEIIKNNHNNKRKREKIRIFWDGPVFIHHEKLLNRLLINHDASIICGSFMSPYINFDINYDSPLYPLTKEKFDFYCKKYNLINRRFNIIDFNQLSSHDLLAIIFFELSFFKHGLEYRQEMIKKTIKKFDIDAAIIHMNQNCRFWSLSQTQLMNYLSNDLKIPALTIQADHLDSRGISEAQLITRIESFLESLSN